MTVACSNLLIIDGWPWTSHARDQKDSRSLLSSSNSKPQGISSSGQYKTWVQIPPEPLNFLYVTCSPGFTVSHYNLLHMPEDESIFFLLLLLQMESGVKEVAIFGAASESFSRLINTFLTQQFFLSRLLVKSGFWLSKCTCISFCLLIWLLSSVTFLFVSDFHFYRQSVSDTTQLIKTLHHNQTIFCGPSMVIFKQEVSQRFGVILKTPKDVSVLTET